MANYLMTILWRTRNANNTEESALWQISGNVCLPQKLLFFLLLASPKRAIFYGKVVRHVFFILCSGMVLLVRPGDEQGKALFERGGGGGVSARPREATR